MPKGPLSKLPWQLPSFHHRSLPLRLNINPELTSHALCTKPFSESICFFYARLFISSISFLSQSVFSSLAEVVTSRKDRAVFGVYNTVSMVYTYTAVTVQSPHVLLHRYHALRNLSPSHMLNWIILTFLDSYDIKVSAISPAALFTSELDSR